MEKLFKEAELLAGRPVDVDQTDDGQYIVLYFRFEASPPPKSPTPEAALRGFIEMMLKRKGESDNLPEADTKGEHNEDRT